VQAAKSAAYASAIHQQNNGNAAAMNYIGQSGMGLDHLDGITFDQADRF
jgi:hypothetical protein